MRAPIERVRVLAATGLTLAATSCTGGINAGEEGGLAFIALTGMLLAILGILWLVLGRED
ncbi:MAG: hypothetical protein ABR529_02840 [Actinomycetota bacterium]